MRAARQRLINIGCRTLLKVHAQIVGARVVNRQRVRIQRRRQIAAGRQVVHTQIDGLNRICRLLGRLRHHGRDGLANKEHFVFG